MDLINTIEFVVSLFLIIAGIMTVLSKDVVRTVIYLSLLSMITSVSFVVLKALDVAMTEIVIGSGLMTFLFLFTLKSSGEVGETK